MGAGKFIWGYEPTSQTWIPIQCDAAGHLVIQLDTLTNLAGDTAGLSAAGIFSISAQSRMKVWHNGLFGVVSGVWTNLPFNNVEWDEQGEWDAVNFRWVASEDGYYHAVASAQWQNLAINVRSQIQFRRNGVSRAVNDSTNVAAAWTYMHMSMIEEIVAGDWIEVRVQHNQGVNKAINGVIGSTWFSVHKLS